MLASGAGDRPLFVVAAFVPTNRTCAQLAHTVGSLFRFHPHAHVLLVDNASPAGNLAAIGIKCKAPCLDPATGKPVATNSPDAHEWTMVPHAVLDFYSRDAFMRLGAALAAPAAVRSVRVGLQLVGIRVLRAGRQDDAEERAECVEHKPEHRVHRVLRRRHVGRDVCHQLQHAAG